IYEKIDFIVGREDIRKWKPEPEGLLKIKEYFGVKKDEMVFIGDLDKDLLTGQNAGIESLLVDELIELVNEFRKES
ncbi:MAG: HAD family hydrolase, partial [Candidatus Odinarchaeota archaeon]